MLVCITKTHFKDSISTFPAKCFLKDCYCSNSARWELSFCIKLYPATQHSWQEMDPRRWWALEVTLQWTNRNQSSPLCDIKPTQRQWSQCRVRAQVVRCPRYHRAMGGGCGSSADGTVAPKKPAFITKPKVLDFTVAQTKCLLPKMSKPPFLLLQMEKSTGGSILAKLLLTWGFSYPYSTNNAYCTPGFFCNVTSKAQMTFSRYHSRFNWG